MTTPTICPAAHNLMALTLSAMKLVAAIDAGNASPTSAPAITPENLDKQFSILQAHLAEHRMRRTSDALRPVFGPAAPVTERDRLVELLALHVQLGRQIVNDHAAKKS